jgi:hypothetical protein
MLTTFARITDRKFVLKGLLTTALSVGVPALSMAKPSETQESAVQNCQFLGKVEGSSGFGKTAGWQPLAKHSALVRAEKMGASHVVWERLIPIGAFNGAAVARAYSCSSQTY